MPGTIKPIGVIGSALRELKEVLYVMDMLRLVLDTLIVFLAVLLAFALLNIAWYDALVPAAVYFGYRFYREWKQNKMRVVEQKVPELDEQLQTVEDNLGRESTILAMLNEDVVRKMKKIKTSLFVNVHDLTVKSVSILLISLIVILVAILNVNFDAKLAAEKAAAPLKNIIRQPSQEIPRVDLASLREGNFSDIFGNKSLAKLGSKELQLVVNPLQSEINLDEVSEAESGDFTPPDFPREIVTSYEDAYAENVPKENQDIIKRYFQQITQ